MKKLLRILGLVAVCFIIASRFINFNSILIDISFIIAIVCFVFSGIKK